MADNRQYSWENQELTVRPEYPHIESWIPAGSSVIDLGCGNGSLLRILKEKKNIREYGIELSEGGVAACRKHGINARQGRIDVAMPDIPDNSFDFAVCNVTLHMVMNPEVTISEMKRIARRQIFSFPNFGFLYQRLELLLMGRMPKKLLYGYTWYSTGHIHQLSIRDFCKTAAGSGLTIKKGVYLVGRHIMPVPLFPNLLATEAIILTEKL